MFLSNKVLTMFKNEPMVSSEASEAVNATKIVSEFVTHCKVLPKTFQAKCREAPGSRKKIAKDYYFNKQ